MARAAQGANATGAKTKARLADAEAKAAADRAERSLGRAVAIALPVAGLLGAIGVAVFVSFAPAILILAATTLLGTIALFWASVRTLSGDAPLPEDLEALAARRHGVNEPAERKRAALRALKDLETERSLGKIDEDDYGALASKYRAEAKEVMREMDLDVAPLLAQAESLARDHLRKKRLLDDESSAPGAPEPETASAPPTASASPVCLGCGTANDADAAFCKKCGKALSGGIDASA